MMAPTKYFACVILAGFFYAQSFSSKVLATEEYPYAVSLKDIQARVEAYKNKIGDKAGVPDTEDTYIKVPAKAQFIKVSALDSAFKIIPALIKHEEKNWQPGVKPTNFKYPLRLPASALDAEVYALKYNFGDRSLNQTSANHIANFFIWTQKEAGTGVYPFPLSESGSGAAFSAVTHFISEAKKQNKLSEVIHNGWLCNDLTDGGLQFDNAEVGKAMFDLYEVTHDAEILASAVKASDWALTHAIVTNWNYNAFSVGLLAKAYAITGNPAYLNEAKRKAILGVIPGQLKQGTNTGRWVDQHNAKPAYHYIMLQALTELVEVMPKDDPARTQIIECIRLGLINRNHDFLTRGAPTKEKALTALLAVKRVFAHDPQFLKDTETSEALYNLELIISSQYSWRNLPVSPREWVIFLSDIKENNKT